jgi:hypothetical protein
MVTALGGPADLIAAPERHLPRAALVRAIPALGAQAPEDQHLGAERHRHGVEARLAPAAGQVVEGLEDSLASGRAAEVFSGMVTALGGPADLIAAPERHLPRSGLKPPRTSISAPSATVTAWKRGSRRRPAR